MERVEQRRARIETVLHRASVSCPLIYPAIADKSCDLVAYLALWYFAAMGRKRPAPRPVATTTARKGRPQAPPRTTLARWIQDHGMTYVEFTALLRTTASQVDGMTRSDAPAVKTLQDVISGRHWPHCRILLLVRLATGGEVDAQHYVLDHRPKRGRRSSARVPHQEVAPVTVDISCSVPVTSDALDPAAL